MTDTSNTAIPAAVADSLIGKEIDGCTIVKKIGQGGMGIVYLAEHTKLRQQYVVKILNPALVAAEDTVQRFFREAQSVARLNHPAIVGIQNVGQEGDYYYIRMEYVDGDTVENIVKNEKKLDWKLATKIILDTSEALSHAHKKGIIHRDIKPENIMFTTNGQVKVMDFGLAKQVQAATKVSVTGQIVGTPFFMSPEQAGGKTTDARSDIYSLGVTFYYILTGMKPFNGKNLQEIFLKHFFYTPESPKIYTPDLPESVCEIIRRCLKKKKKERYQAAADLSKDLRIALGQEEGTIQSADSIVSTGGDDDESGQRPALNGVATDDAGPPSPGPDIAQAKAEIASGDADPTSTVQVSGRPRPSLGGPDDAAPVQKRQRGVALDQVSGASLVFGGQSRVTTAKGVIETPAAGATAPVAEGEESAPVQKRERGPALDKVTGASLVFEKKKGEAGASPSGTATGTSASPETDSVLKAAEAASKGETKPVEKKPPAKPRGRTAPLAVLAIVLLGAVGAGTYEIAGRSKYTSIERRYAELQKTPVTPDNEVAPWEKRAKEYQQIALDFDDFKSMFGFCTKASEASDIADKARDAWKNAEQRAIAIKNGGGGDKIQKGPDPKVDAAKQLVDKTAQDAKVLESQHKYADAAKLLIDPAWGACTDAKLGVSWQQKLYLPIEITTSPPGCKITNLADGTVIGETPANGSLLYHARPFSQLKLEIKHPHFVAQKWEDAIKGYQKVDVTLERETQPAVTIGQAMVKRFRKDNFERNPDIEPVYVDAPFAIDPQAQALIFMTRQGDLRSVDMKGRSNWHFEKGAQAIVLDQTGDIMTSYGDPSGGPEIIPNRAIFTATTDGYVRGYEEKNGALVWASGPFAPIRARPVVTADFVHLIVGTMDGQIVCLNAMGDGQGRGRIEWTFLADAAIETRAATRGDLVYVASRDGKLRTISLSTGKLVASYDAQDAICAGPVLSGDRIYVGTRSGRVHSLAIADPTKSVYEPTEAIGAPIIDIARSEDSVFFATSTELRAISAKTGLQLFAPYPPGAPIAGFVPMSDRVAIVTATGVVTALDGKTGEVAWWHAIKDAKSQTITVGAPPVVIGGWIYIVTREGRLNLVAAD